MPLRTPRGKKRTALLLKLKLILSKLSLSTRGGVDRADQPNLARLGEVLCRRPLESVLPVHPRLAREEDPVTPGKSSPAPRLRMEAVGVGNGCGGLPRVPSRLSTVVLDSRPDPVGPITLAVKCAGTRGAGKPHATGDVA
jgi:hypothetical protein